MKIAYWNVRGAMKKNLGENISSFSKLYDINIMAISETKSDNIHYNKTNQFFGFQNYDFTPCVGKSGGIWLLWNSTNIKITILLKEVRFISVLVKDTSTNIEFCCIFTYAPPKQTSNTNFGKTCQNIVKVVSQSL